MHAADRSNARGVCMRCVCPVAQSSCIRSYFEHAALCKLGHGCIIVQVRVSCSFRKKQKNVFYEMWSRRLNCAANECISQEEEKCILQKATVTFAIQTMFRWLEF
jgi:hypothetical protein